MPEMDSPETTHLQDLPKRFWTPEVAKIALQQGHYHLTHEMVEDLLSRKNNAHAETLNLLLREALEGINLERRRRRYKSVLSELNRYLRQARKLKRERSFPLRPEEESSNASTSGAP